MHASLENHIVFMLNKVNQLNGHWGSAFLNANVPYSGGDRGI